MQKLAKAQSEGDFGPETAPRYLLTVLTQLLVDQLEHPTGISSISSHGNWLSNIPSGEVSGDFAGNMNGFLLTSDRRWCRDLCPGNCIPDKGYRSVAFGVRCIRKFQIC